MSELTDCFTCIRAECAGAKVAPRKKSIQSILPNMQSMTVTFRPEIYLKE